MDKIEFVYNEELSMQENVDSFVCVMLKQVPFVKKIKVEPNFVFKYLKIGYVCWLEINGENCEGLILRPSIGSIQKHNEFKSFIFSLGIKEEEYDCMSKIIIYLSSLFPVEELCLALNNYSGTLE